MCFVVLEDICGLSVRIRDESLAPHSRFPPIHVQVPPEFGILLGYKLLGINVFPASVCVLQQGCRLFCSAVA